jgi:hypothetical protein
MRAFLFLQRFVTLHHSKYGFKPIKSTGGIKEGLHDARSRIASQKGSDRDESVIQDHAIASRQKKARTSRAGNLIQAIVTTVTKTYLTVGK